MKALVLGSGPVKPEDKKIGYIYLDIEGWGGVDVIRDIEKGLPFDDNKFDRIEAHNILEHIKDLIFVMNECYRVLKVGGTLDIIVPFGRNATIDPTHVRNFYENDFSFFINCDFNSLCAGVKGWYDLDRAEYLGPSKEDPRVIHFILKSREIPKQEEHFSMLQRKMKQEEIERRLKVKVVKDDKENKD